MTVNWLVEIVSRFTPANLTNVVLAQEGVAKPLTINRFVEIVSLFNPGNLTNVVLAQEGVAKGLTGHKRHVILAQARIHSADNSS